MNPINSSTGARGLLPAWPSGKEKKSDVDDGLLRPIAQERAPWGSESTAGLDNGGKKGNIFDDTDQINKLSLVKRREIHSKEDLEYVTDRRKRGEKYLRSSLVLAGTLATDITRRLDYTYYNLLEKIAALRSTTASFQELYDSISTLFDDFEKETTSLGQEIRKQTSELKAFQPQVQKIDALEWRMRAGKTRADALNERLDAVRSKIDWWERREAECQIRIHRRLRAFWIVVMTGITALFVAFIIPNISAESSGPESLAQVTMLAYNSSHILPYNEKESNSRVLYPSNLDNKHSSFQSRQFSQPADPPTSAALGLNAEPTEQDPLNILNEL
ncbi:hypothetical protein EYZ11_013076 [Aspergillus tanneri]|uniref:Uncharacterized protein n=1 Tax=Aspergillus tanneri TaxID=1220188 RepID=A0A4S3IYL6_9EURO|nr:uncharacterized protein ATNIH1004_009093 [Aspergillus tanneri]KAA8644884.1 hypothetical protein ATNIH1004_009093 [Aspergillus tanneri]THC87480.1 hypothetical protein EYZ11_013076 [Aspergillus tanneri]